MAGEAGATPTPGATPDPAGQPPESASQEPAPQQTPQEGDPLGPAGIEALRKEREARAALQAANRDLEAQLRQLRDKDKPEDQRTKDQIAELQRAIAQRDDELRQTRIESAVTVTGAKLGIIDLEVATVLLERAGTLELDATGKPVNTEAALRALVKERPYLVRPAGTANAGAGTSNRQSPPGQSTDMNDRIRGSRRRPAE